MKATHFDHREVLEGIVLSLVIRGHADRGVGDLRFVKHLKPEHFIAPMHQTIYRHIQKVSGNGKPVCAQYVMDSILAAGDDSEGIASHIDMLAVGISGLVNPDDVCYWASQLWNSDTGARK